MDVAENLHPLAPDLPADAFYYWLEDGRLRSSTVKPHRSIRLLSAPAVAAARESEEEIVARMQDGARQAGAEVANARAVALASRTGMSVEEAHKILAG